MAGPLNDMIIIPKERSVQLGTRVRNKGVSVKTDGTQILDSAPTGWEPLGKGLNHPEFHHPRPSNGCFCLRVSFPSVPAVLGPAALKNEEVDQTEWWAAQQRF